MKIFKAADDRHEFKPLLVEIEERPLNPLGRAVFWIVIAAIVFTVLWMFFGQVDVVVTARGKIIPSGEVKVVQPLNSGVVRSILIKPGDYVARGQVLMEIDPSDVDPELASMQADRRQVALEIERITALLENRPFRPRTAPLDAEVLRVQVQLYRSEKERLAQQLEIKRDVLAQQDEKLEAEYGVAAQSEYLVAIWTDKLRRLRRVADIVSCDQREQTESELKRHQTQERTARHRIAELTAMKNQTRREMAFVTEEFRSRLLAELAEKKQRELYLEAKIEKAEFISTRQQICAPVAGHVSQLLFHTVGGVVSPAEKLAFIVPAASPLLVKALLLNKDAGFVETGMAASVKVDTFSFQKYGTIEGTVRQVSKDSVEDRQLGLVYEAYIRPETMALSVDGEERPLAVGMGVTAEVRVGKRRIIEFFLYPLVKYLDEGISVR